MAVIPRIRRSPVWLRQLLLALAVISLREASVSAAPWRSLSKERVRALFPQARAVSRSWRVEGGGLDETLRNQIKSEPNLEIGSYRAATWKVSEKAIEICAIPAPQNVDCDVGSGSYMVAIFSRNKLLARARELFPLGSNADAATDEVLQIDTAPYRITENERAFAIRNKHSTTDGYMCFADQTLDLFRIVGSDIVRILHTDVVYEQISYDPHSEDAERHPTCKVSPKEGTFRMLPTKTNGFFDIERTQKSAGKLTYRWNGSAYEPATPDPADHSVRERLDWCTGLHSEERRKPNPNFDENGMLIKKGKGGSSGQAVESGKGGDGGGTGAGGQAGHSNQASQPSGH